MEADNAQSIASSSLSSLTPSPCSAGAGSPSRKRPRVSSASPPVGRHSLACGPPGASIASQCGGHTFRDLLDGLEDDDFRMLPSSDPVTFSAQAADPPSLVRSRPGAAARSPDVTGDTDDTDLGLEEGLADDSGVGLLADVERDKTVSHELDGPEAPEDVEYEGDDMWLEFDDAAVGFDQPDTFPSSALSIGAPRGARDGRADGAPPTDTEDSLRNREEPRLGDFGFASLNPAASLTGGGFVFAMRKPLVLSEAALRRARALLEAEDIESSRDIEPAAPKRATMPGARLSSDLAGVSPTAGGPSADTASTPAAPAATMAFVGFQNGAGRALQMPSEEAMQRARDRLAAPDSPDPARADRVRNPLRPLALAGASTRDVFGDVPAPVVPRSRASADPKFTLPPPLGRPGETTHQQQIPGRGKLAGTGHDSPTTKCSRSSSTEPTVLLGPRPGSPNRPPLLPVNGEASTRTYEVTEKESSTAALQSSSPSRLGAYPSSPPLLPESADSATALLAPTTAQPISARSGPGSAARSGNFRPPLLASTSTPSRLPDRTPLRAFAATGHSPLSTSYSRATPNPTLSQNRRLNLGVTPRNKPFHLANTLPGLGGTPLAGRGKTGVKAFVSPFRGGKPPEGLTPMGLKDKLTESVVRSSSMLAMAEPKGLKTATEAGGKRRRAIVENDETLERRKVFELHALGTARLSLSEFGMRPQMHFYEAVEAVGISRPVLDMDVTSALPYTFLCGRGVSDAFVALQDLVAARAPEDKDLVTLPWVKNHWRLILWKMASYVRSRPDLFGDWWTFARVMDQLRYRYEREVNRAERSAVKRIQERDSPASLPMILCVSQIRWDEPPEGADQGTLVVAGLELTDGWYRIRTNVDQTLKRACERGKLVVGSKIAISGAKLDSATQDGVEVLRALSLSSLVISGNSTSLAPWYATLGFRPEPFVAGLTSLSASGGLVPLVDVVVDRVFACGYIDLRKGRGTETWGAEEEVTRAEEWKRGRRCLEEKLAEEAEKGGTEEDGVVELLQEVAVAMQVVGDDTSAPQPTPSEEPDEILDRLVGASNKRSLVRKLSARQAHHVLQLAVERAREARSTLVQDLQKELAEKYPPRDIRCFRILRVSDARQGSKATMRSALLTVWDAERFNVGFFSEGKRYLISNLVPKGSWRPQDREVSLATKRDSRWRKVQ